MFTKLKLMITNVSFKPIVGLVVLSGLSTCIDTVEPNHVAYSNLFGKINETKLGSGFHWKNPFAHFVKIPLLSNNITLDIDVATKEGLNLSVQTNTIYKLDEDKTLQVFMKFRNNYENIFIKPQIESKLRNIMSSYEAKDLYSEITRLEIKNKIMEETSNQKWKSEGFIVDNILINRIKLPMQLQQSIENKLKSEQENEQMAFIIEKEKKQIIFSIEKEKMESERKIIEANGIKAFQDIVSKGISKEFQRNFKGINYVEGY
jgi:regulator of protease activity HflC (stomatin/prohibitin superfamily)